MPSGIEILSGIKTDLPWHGIIPFLVWAWQVTRGLARLPGPVQLLCARACNEDITEVNFIGLDGIASVECLAHDYQVQELQAAAPTTECWQQIIADMAAANTTGKEQDADHASDMTDRLHELYEWMGAISCGITGDRSVSVAHGPHAIRFLHHAFTYSSLLQVAICATLKQRLLNCIACVGRVRTTHQCADWLCIVAVHKVCITPYLV